jgi:hypothetical protein
MVASRKTRFGLTALSLSFSSLLSLSSAATAFDINEPGTSATPNLNLGSIAKNVTVPGGVGTVTLLLNGRAVQVSSGDRVTAAMAAGAEQIAATGNQTVLLGRSGNAVGGSLAMSPSATFTSVTVPANVSLIRNFALSPLELAGNFYNAGRFVAFSLDPAVNNAIISAKNITNTKTGIITSIVPSEMSTWGANPNLNLSLVAYNFFRNSGEISSAGDLNIIAGNQLHNQGPASSNAPVMSSLGAMNIAAKHIVNKGTFDAGTDMTIVQQVARNAALTAVADELDNTVINPNLINVRNLIINANKGTFSAENGAITIDTQNHLKANKVNIVKGEYLSQTFVMDAGDGTIHLHADKVTGLATLTAGDIKFGPKNRVSFTGTISLEEGDESGPLNKKKDKRQLANDKRENHYTPVSFVHPTLKLTDREVAASNVLIAPKMRDAIASAGSVRIHVSKGAAAFVINTGSRVCVMSLHDGKTGDVSVLAGDQEVNLRAGEQVVLSDSVDETQNAQDLPAVGVRGSSEHTTSNGLKAVVSEFSLPSAMLQIQRLRDLKNSPEHSHQQLYAKMLKNAAVLHTVGARKGTYKAML